MRALIEIDITGDFEEPLTNDAIIDILNTVVVDGAESVALTGRYKLVKMLTEVPE